MNRPGTIPQSMRGLPAGFGGQQPQQPGRVGTNRVANGKLGTNGSGWAFGTGMTMGGSGGGVGGGLPGSARPLGGNLSFAQSLSGSQPATPLDLTEFPSLSTNPQLSTPNQQSMWSAGGASRNTGGPVQRNTGTPLSAQTAQQDDLFTSRLTSTQASFRFGSQASQGQSSQAQVGGTDDFPPLSRNANGDMSEERGQSLVSSLVGGAQPVGSSTMPSNRGGNGLLNALTANSRVGEARSPSSIQRPDDGRNPLAANEARRKSSAYREGSQSSDPATQLSENRNPLGAIGNDAPAKAKEEGKGQASSMQDPLEGMSPADKWGLKGLRTLMTNYPDYNALTVGIDPASLGLDLSTPDLITSQVFSLFNDAPPRPAVPRVRIPDCYYVNNTAPIESKIQSFNEETLMWIFYSSPGDIKQHWAAVELTTRNWRWHKKLQIWLTKDDMMVPQALSHNHERGYYVVWDTIHWRKERRELTLHYSDLDSNPNGPQLQV